MNKRQRKKQQKKQQQQQQDIDISKAFKNFGATLSEAADAVKGWLEAIPQFIDKQVQERPEVLREQLLGKEGRLLRWEQLLLNKCEVEIRRRIQEIGGDSLIDFDYTNWKGEPSVRIIRFEKIYFGYNDFHTGEQWFVRGYDVEKKAVRDFAFQDMRNILEWRGTHDDEK